MLTPKMVSRYAWLNAIAGTLATVIVHNSSMLNYWALLCLPLSFVSFFFWSKYLGKDLGSKKFDFVILGLFISFLSVVTQILMGVIIFLVLSFMPDQIKDFPQLILGPMAFIAFVFVMLWKQLLFLIVLTALSTILIGFRIKKISDPKPL